MTRKPESPIYFGKYLFALLLLAAMQEIILHQGHRLSILLRPTNHQSHLFAFHTFVENETLGSFLHAPEACDQPVTVRLFSA